MLLLLKKNGPNMYSNGGYYTYVKFNQQNCTNCFSMIRYNTE